MLGSNANGITNKQDSLKHTISTLKPSIVTLQETKARKLGSVKLQGYQIFEKLRTGIAGGGLLTAVDENLAPVLISTGKEDESEILTVQVKAGQHDIRIINAYGPQEDDGSKQEIYKFWQEVEEEITTAKDDQCLVVLQLDANAKIGKQYIKDDPNDTTANGKILLDVVERQNLTIANTLNLCKGVITRERATTVKVEKAVIDYIIVCEDMKNYLEKMTIDEDRIFVLTKYASKKGLKKKTVSDHNILFGKFSILFDRQPKTLRREFFNLKDKVGQKAFLEETSASEALSSSFLPSRSFPHNANIFFKSLNGCIHKCFDKIRISSGGKIGSNPIQEKMKLRTELKIFVKNCSCQIEKKKAEDKLEEVENFLTENCAAKNAEIIKEHIREVEREDGNFSQLKMWKLKKKLCPKIGDPPMAKKDENGTLISQGPVLTNECTARS